MAADLKLIKDGEVDGDSFVVPATDTKGHSARQWFRCVPSMARQVEQAVQSRQFPYRTRGDLLRHALHRHMKWLSTIGDVPSITGQVDAILEVIKDEEMSDDFQEVFTKLGDRISYHMGCGSEEEARRLVSVVQNHVNSMPEGFWKDKYRASMKAKYGTMMGKAPKANFGNMEE